MPGHHDDKHRDHAEKRDKKGHGNGPKEKEIAAALTAATVSLAGSSISYASLDAASDAVAAVYAKMFALIGGEAPRVLRPSEPAEPARV